MSPPTVPRRWKIGVGLLYVTIVIYSVVVMQQVILGTVLPALVIAMVYFTWRVLRLFETRYEHSEAQTQEDPFEVLKHRYAEGEISEEVFEHQVEQLLEADQRSRPDVSRDGPGEPTGSHDDASVEFEDDSSRS